MSKNYSNYSKPNKTEDEIKAVKEVVENTSADEPVVEPAAKKVETPTYVGFVSDCARLRVRAQANTDAKVICEIDKDTAVTIIDDSLEGWYKVRLKSGLKGFCMRQYITV